MMTPWRVYSVILLHVTAIASPLQESEPCPEASCRFASRTTPFGGNLLFQAFARLENDEDALFRLSTEALLMVSAKEIDLLDAVTVSYQLQGFEPTQKDWIGIYCIDEHEESLPDRDYMDWRWTEGRSAGCIHVGSLVNMRCAWQFRFFTLSETGEFIKVGESDTVRFRGGPTEPQQVHLALTEQPNSMRVMWTSAAAHAPKVWYGVSSKNLTESSRATSTTYAADDMCGTPATLVSAQFYRDPGMLNSAVMSDLRPNTTYYYAVGSDHDGRSAVHEVQTPPEPSLDMPPMSFFVFGDLGDWNIRPTGDKPVDRTATTIQLMYEDLNDPSRTYAAIFHVGDLSYAMGRTYLWDQFGSMIEPVAARLPYMVGVGNHEYDYLSGGEKDPSGASGNGFHPSFGNYAGDSQGECGVPYNKRYIMPANGNQAFWWSVDIGLTHHVMISSEHDFTPSSVMYKWLEQDLAQVDRRKTPWLILHTHRPLYCSVRFAGDYKLSLSLRRHLEPLLAKYHVDLVFSGHYHAYERTCPVFDGYCRDSVRGNDGFEHVQAPVHIMVGAAGADLATGQYYDVSWRAAALMDFGYGRLHVHNTTHAHFEFKHNHNRTVVDATWIISSHNWTLPEH
ncbi:hypothetical protein Poli38472_011439 [Pythium oligandrum]|uniref:Purple acid phosphatase n=1 Tax=Pythium oligandrum TaxID=41045 RepID=A0A8K1FKU5_PYTOL|nr:hypothetical protein Poli38472_011439 [Pythium oligandrum]|eukprot:TMW64559.1 hypothetical protein Poli38472_011439 [Pythium oligandrum]